MRLAKVAGPVLSRLPAEIAHRAAINGMKLAPPPRRPLPIRASRSRFSG